MRRSSHLDAEAAGRRSMHEASNGPQVDDQAASRRDGEGMVSQGAR